ncbi:MAG TPA: hypothetical protein VFT45_18695, partial [Longimicrobium sp.]|nr:hypothetical protein [Longimicrobium sp.]
MNRLALSLAAAALAGCISAPAAQTYAPAPEAAMPQESLRRLPDAQQGVFQYNSGVETATRETIRDAAAWR